MLGSIVHQHRDDKALKCKVHLRQQRGQTRHNKECCCPLFFCLNTITQLQALLSLWMQTKYRYLKHLETKQATLQIIFM